MKMMTKAELFLETLSAVSVLILWHFKAVTSKGKVRLFQSKNAFQSFLMIQVHEGNENEILLLGVNCDS